MSKVTARVLRIVTNEMADFIEEPDDWRAEWNKSQVERWLLALAPPIKRRTFSKATRAKRATKRELDALCREVVFLRDKCCRRCGGTNQLQWAHIFSRRFASVRHDPLNSCLLCASCHFWQHHNPIEGGRFFEKMLGAAAYKALAYRKTRGGKPDPALLKRSLEEEKKQLEGE